MKSNFKMKTVSVLSALVITASLSTYSVDAASRNWWYRTKPTTTTPTTTTPTTTTPTTTTPTTTTPTTTTPTTTITGAVDLCTSYGLIAGQKLYYNSATNRHYYDSSFTKTPQKVSAILNKAFLDNKGKGVTIVIPAGDYLLDQRLILQDGITLAGVSGQTRLFIDDTFTVVGDDCIISNEDNAKIAIKDLYVEYKGFKTPDFSDYSVNPSGIEGIMLKIRNTTKATVENSSFVVKNNGVKTKITPVWVRDGFSNIDIHDCYIENTSGEITGGCLWFMNNNGDVGDTVKVYNNTIVKNGFDEAIAIWGDGGINQNYNIYNNTINYVKGTLNTACDKLIAVNGSPNVTYKNIKFSNNNMNLTGNVRRIIMCDVSASTFSGVVFEGNNIKDSAGDSTGDFLLSTFEVWSYRLSSEPDNETMYKRCDISFNNNNYTNTSAAGRRCLVSCENALMKLNGNTVNSNFVYCVIFGADDNSKIVSSGNDYNYSGIGQCDLAWITGANTKAYFNNDKISLGGTSAVSAKLSYVNCIFG